MINNDHWFFVASFEVSKSIRFEVDFSDRSINGFYFGLNIEGVSSMCFIWRVEET